MRVSPKLRVRVRVRVSVRVRVRVRGGVCTSIQGTADGYGYVLCFGAIYRNPRF